MSSSDQPAEVHPLEADDFDREERVHSPDARRFRRYPAPLEAQLLVDGAPWHCRILDISVDGAGLNPAMPAALGRQVELHSHHFDFGSPLPGKVVNVALERTCLAFDLDDSVARELTIYLASTVDGR